jgi:transcriptional regulator with XRE-family HTH domain
MEWQGSKLREVLQAKNVSVSAFAEKLNVSRQAVNDWLNGTVPKGSHLLALCQTLGIMPDSLFNALTPDIVVPVHRTRKTAKLTEARQELAFDLAKKYEGFYRNRSRIKLQRVIQFPEDHNDKDLCDLPKKLRSEAGVKNYYPLLIQDVFRLLEKLEVEVIFRRFPSELKSYAFFTEIYGYPVVFVNTANNVLDLSFPLLHEAIHALCSHQQKAQEFSEAEESLCDLLAGQVLFTPEYIQEVSESIQGHLAGKKITVLKRFALNYHHSIYGLARELKRLGITLPPSVNGADANLHKNLESLEEILSSNGDASRFVKNVFAATPIFMKELKKRLPAISDSLLADWLDLSSSLDAGEVRHHIMSTVEND